VRPGRNEGGKGVEPGCIGVGVGADVDPRGASRINAGDDLGHAAPVGLAGRLQVPDFDWYVRLAPDSHCFIDCIKYGVALASHVRRVDASIPRSYAGESDQLLSFGVGSGCILQCRGEPHCSILHGLAHERLHRSQLRRVGCTSASPSTIRRTLVAPT